MKKMKGLIVGVIAATATLFAVVAFANNVEQFGPYECGEASCKGKVSAKFYSETVGTCYSLKASCKGAYVGAKWTVHLAEGGNHVVVETTPDAAPECEPHCSAVRLWPGRLL